MPFDEDALLRHAPSKSRGSWEEEEMRSAPTFPSALDRGFSPRSAPKRRCKPSIASLGIHYGTEGKGWAYVRRGRSPSLAL